MKVTVLGCGSSGGVPLVGCACPVCTSSHPKNTRHRASILIEVRGVRLLIDTSPDLRAQCLRANIKSVDAILYTHAHADHCHGIDDVRSLNYHAHGGIDVYGHAACLKELKERFSYAFGHAKPENQQDMQGWYRPLLIPHEVDPEGMLRPFKVADEVEVIPFLQRHGKGISLGYRVEDFAYSTDVNNLPEESLQTLENLRVWLVDCLRYNPSPSHAHLDMTLGWIQRVAPERAILTHMGHELEYEALKTLLPASVEPAYDGMVIDLGQPASASPSSSPSSSSKEPVVTDEFAAAFDLLEHSRQNVFLTGKAGTGKSTFLRYLREHTSKKIAVVAPTGVAALNVQGQTIHSFFRLKPSFVQVAHLRGSRRRVLKELELLIIDEISMVRADVFEGMDHMLRLARRNDLPFGGVQVCVIGDLFQLPPVVSNEEKHFFSDYYRSPFFFCTKSYEEAQFQVVQFTTIHRQNDSAFIHLLNAIRAGACGAEELEALNCRVHPRATPAPGTLVLTTTNALAEAINHTKLEQLPGAARAYEGDLTGEFGMKGARLPAPEQLALKVGAQVMFVKNDSEGRWVNGTIGIVEALGSDSITVKTGEDSYEVEREKWNAIGYEFEEEQGEIVEKTLGSYTQFPLILAWAITIHKSQGKTLERVIIDLGRGAFAAGQLYVALSRCTSLSGIALKQPVMPADVRCDAQVVEFMCGLDA